MCTENVVKSWTSANRRSYSRKLGSVIYWFGGAIAATFFL